MRALTILDTTGDTTIVWDESSDEEMEKTIAVMMSKGISFFIIEPRFFGLVPSKQTKLENAEDAKKHRALSIRDEDLAKFVSSGAGEVVNTPATAARGSRKAKSAAEVASSESIGVKPLRGG